MKKEEEDGRKREIKRKCEGNGERRDKKIEKEGKKRLDEEKKKMCERR